MQSGTPIKEYVVKPISNAEYDRQMSKAYSKPLKKQAWRLFVNTETGFDIYSELIPRDSSTETTCELHPILHMDILMKAVELAAVSRGMRPAQQTRQEQ